MPHYGLSAPAAICAFLSREPRLRQEIEAFIVNGEPRVLDIAGPPEGKDMVDYRENLRKGLWLPVVRLYLGMVRHHLTGELGVEIRCTDEHLHRIIDWMRSARLRRAISNRRMA